MNVLLYHLLRHTLWRWLRWYYRIHVFGDPPPRYRPRVVIANHVNFWDPFLVAFALRQPLSFVAADGNFRSRKMRFLMNLAGQVPKAKGRTDMQSIRQLRALVRQGQGVAIFPEGQRTWDGEARPLLPGIEKLIRLLGAPVVAVQIRGAYRSLPRWSPRGKRGRIEIRITTLSATQTLSLTAIAHSIHVSEDQWQEERRVRFVGPRRAEGLEALLFLCPQCHGWGTLHTRGTEIICQACGTHRMLTGQGSFHTGPFSTVAPWHRYQMAHLRRDLAQPRPLSLPLHSSGVHMFQGYRMRPPAPLGVGTIRVDILSSSDAANTRSRAQLEVSGRSRTGVPFSLSFPVQELTGITVQYTRQLELYHEGKLYVLSLRGSGARAYRVEQTLLILQELYRTTTI